MEPLLIWKYQNSVFRYRSIMYADITDAQTKYNLPGDGKIQPSEKSKFS